MTLLISLGDLKNKPGLQVKDGGRIIRFNQRTWRLVSTAFAYYIRYQLVNVKGDNQ